MELDIYIKNKKDYELRRFSLSENNAIKLAEQLFFNVEKELTNIRSSILSYENDENSINLKKPIHKNKEIHKKLQDLNNIRSVNLRVKEKLAEILRPVEYIKCFNCKGKMYKKPVGVPYEKIGKHYIVKYNEIPSKYIYSCENCVFFEEEILYKQTQYLKQKRENLLKEGYNFVPNDFGNWGYVGNEPPKIEPDLIPNPIKIWKRESETFKIKGKEFIKITETCEDNGEIKRIK